MKIRIYGYNSRIDNKTIRSAVRWYAMFLMDQRSVQKLDIWVDLETNYAQNFKGQADVYSDSTCRFVITLDDALSMRSTLIALAHEMVHVKQYARRELTYNRRCRMHRFQGKSYNNDYLYWNRPWEIEAFGRELGLYRMFTESQKAKKNGRKKK